MQQNTSALRNHCNHILYDLIDLPGRAQAKYCLDTVSGWPDTRPVDRTVLSGQPDIWLSNILGAQVIK
ncbi:MAG: hypothetical protein MJE77_01415 [Proteobacteria bacterium]|nr:hypothetical protein [Pseudomonadota bacterium]